MIVEIGKKKVDVKYLDISATVRIVSGSLIPPEQENLPCTINGVWCPQIDIETGRITNWEHRGQLKVDVGVIYFEWELQDRNCGVIIRLSDALVPAFLCVQEEGSVCDRIIVNISKDGLIENWKFNIDDLI